MYGVPMHTSQVGFFYNKDLFAKAGVDATCDQDLGRPARRGEEVPGGGNRRRSSPAAPTSGRCTSTGRISPCASAARTPSRRRSRAREKALRARPSSGPGNCSSSLSTSSPSRRASSPSWLHKPSSRIGGTAAVALLFLPPALFLFTLFVAVPMGEAAWYSVFNWNGYGAPTQFVGWRNFELLFANRAFRIALTNNLLVIAASLLVQLPLALAMAVLLADRVRGTTTFRLIFFLPYILAEVAAGLIWRFVYDGEYGLIAKIWEAFGATPPHVLAEPDLAMYAILVVVVWKYFGFHMMLYIAGLQQIDRSLYEAARIDGATGWQAFSRITVPLSGRRSACRSSFRSSARSSSSISSCP